MLTTTTKEDIDKMIATGKVKLSKWESFWHFSIVPFILIIPAYATWSLLEYYVLDSYNSVRTPIEIADGYWAIPFVIFFYYLQKRRLRFKVFNAKISDEVFDKATLNTAKELNWKIKKSNSNYVRAVRNGKEFDPSWGELITIIKTKDILYINSICDPNIFFSSIISYGWNKHNVVTFIKNLNKEIENNKQ